MNHRQDKRVKPDFIDFCIFCWITKTMTFRYLDSLYLELKTIQRTVHEIVRCLNL